MGFLLAVYCIRMGRPVNVTDEAAVRRPLGGSTGARLLALFLCGAALRPQLVGVTPLLPDLERDLGLSHAVAGVLTALPLVCMGAFAAAGAPSARALGSRLAVGASLVLVAASGAVRAAWPSVPALVLLTLGVGVGIALAGAVLPQVVKESFGGHPVRATGTYAAGIQVGSTVSAAAAVPLALALGGWRGSLAIFAGFTFLVLAIWFILAPPSARPDPAAVEEKARGPVAGVGLLAVTFALFSAGYYGLVTWLPEIYIRHGWSPVAAGWLLGALNASAMAGGFAVALLAGRRRSSHAVVLGLAACFATAITGFVLLPAVAGACAVVAGAANGALLPLVLAQPLELSADPAIVARASAAMLGVGYTIAAAVPVAFGGARDLTGSFGVTEALLTATGWAFVVAVAVAARGARGAPWPGSQEPL
jgi:CP family cyanate transporter-like MFS transporter